jgi:hypothetical protein
VASKLLVSLFLSPHPPHPRLSSMSCAPSLGWCVGDRLA